MKSCFKNRSSKETKTFYDDLSLGNKTHIIWGMNSRFNADSIAKKPSVHRHFVDVVNKFLLKDSICLDLGCGPGVFLSLAAPFCLNIIGADIVPGFVKECQATINRNKIVNANVVQLHNNILPFLDGHFDRVLMVDTIHHLENSDQTLSEVARILKPGGLLLIFEPNKLNPLLAFLCALDPNEHGLLRLGSFSAYQSLLKDNFVIEHKNYNGLLIGPQGKVIEWISDFVSSPKMRMIRWLSPKIFILARRKY